MATKNQKELNSLKAEMRKLKNSRAGCRGEPEMLRDLDDQVRHIQEKIRQLERDTRAAS